ncbi:phenylacetate--CoA ligase family protein, partial [Chloroflexota bacterium]
MKCLKELEESQWWSRDKILELQNQRLRQLVRHVYDNVPYYRRIFDERALKPSDIESGEDLVKLPVLTKKLIRDNFDDMMARGFPAREIITHCTGGSTGEPLMFYVTKDEVFNWGLASSHREYGWS